jgi:6-phosphogluconolactonase
MVRESLLSRVSMKETNAYRIRGEDEPAIAAAAYELQLRGLLNTPEGVPVSVPARRIDFAMLGLGEDGHIASLFPGARAIHQSERWVEATTAPTEPSQRITLTPIVLNAAAEILFLVTGSAKAAILRRVLEEPLLPSELPAQLIAPVDGSMHWVVDAAAAREVSKS